MSIMVYHVIRGYKDNERVTTGNTALVMFGQRGGIGLSWIMRTIVELDWDQLEDVRRRTLEGILLILDHSRKRSTNFADEGPEVGDRLPAGLTEHGLEAREGFFDRVEVEPIGKLSYL